jgi:Cu(I)/Ag(I) efflux system membrane protein CusA/SilA
MPPLDEGSLLVMPTTFPGISIEEARQVMTRQNRRIMSFAEVASVHGKVGRAETATDPAQLDMIESVIALRPRETWPSRAVQRWYSGRYPAVIEQQLRRFWPDQQPRTLTELSDDIARALRTPGYQMAISPPIRTRIDMLTTGVRTPVGIKVFGDDLTEIERVSVALEEILGRVPGTRSTFAERQTGREYLDIVPDRDAIARFGLTVRDVHDVVEMAIGGMQLSTVIDGRARFPVNVRFGADFRGDLEALRGLLVPVPPATPVAEPATALGGGGASAAGPAMSGSAGRSGGSMGGMASMGSTDGSGTMRVNAPRAAGASSDPDWLSAWQPAGAVVPLGALADVRVVTGPPMIKTENGRLVGYVFADVDGSIRDLGGWVRDARRLVDALLELPAGMRLAWTGQYEFLADMQSRLAWMVPLTLALIVGLLYLAMGGWGQALLVLLSVPFAVAGSIWLLAVLDYNLSTAVWVGIIAVGGVAAQTAIVVVVYLDQALKAAHDAVALQAEEAIDAAVVEGATRGFRPMLMTVATTVLGLMPLLWESGVGADLSARTAAPVVGGMVSCLVLTLLVVPGAYAMWRRWQWRRGILDLSFSS